MRPIGVVSLSIAILAVVGANANAEDVTIEGRWAVFDVMKRVEARKKRLPPPERSAIIVISKEGTELCGRYEAEPPEIKVRFNELPKEKRGRTECEKTGEKNDKVMMWAIPAAPRGNVWAGGGLDKNGLKGGMPGRLLDVRDESDPVIGDEDRQIQLIRQGKRVDVWVGSQKPLELELLPPKVTPP